MYAVRFCVLCVIVRVVSAYVCLFVLVRFECLGIVATSFERCGREGGRRSERREIGKGQQR